MAKLVYRPVSAGFLRDVFSGAFPAWVRALRGKSGVYVIRDAINKQTRYVGESHTGKLYETLTRHFQSWSGPTSGPTYDRAFHEVAVQITRPVAAVARQNALICKLVPRDNDLSPGCKLPGRLVVRF